MDNWMFQPSGGQQAGQSNVSDSNLSALRNNASSPDSGAKSSSRPAPRIRRRNRVINSCLECRRRKLKCDKQAPCTNCTRFKRDCLYLAPSSDPQHQQKLSEIKDRMGALEKNLEREVAAGQQSKPHAGGANVTRASSGEPGVGVVITGAEGEDGDDFGGGEGGSDEDNLEPTPLTALDNVYEDNEDDELVDLGVQMGKMRISERIGGWIRPKLVEELTDTLEDVQVGKSRHSNSPQIKDHHDLKPGQAPRILANPKSYIGPGPDYIPPASSFFFPGTNLSTTLMDYLPSKNAADILIAQYFYSVHYVARAVHRPTFERQYAQFWQQITQATEPKPSQQAVIFAAMFSAAVSMDDNEVAKNFGTTRNTLVDSLRSGTEMALAKANFLRTTKTDTMQAFCMYLIPLCRAEVSRAHSALVGTAIRLAECMGLHRDGTHYNLPPIDTHVRRIIWHELMFLDMRTCEATGPRPTVRKDDYDTQFPLNINDDDLLLPNPPTEDRPYWTDMTLFRIRAEGFDLRRVLWFDIVQIDRKKKSLTSAVIKVQKFRARLNATYLHTLDETIPQHSMALHVLRMSTHGAFIQVLHRYLFSTAQRMPDRLRQILIEAGVTQLENAIALETKPELAPWKWYRGALQQFHAALLLMVEVYAYPMRKDAAKIWKCLDYIFEIPPHLTPKQKAELVLTDLRDRMVVYHQMRKVKSTTQMEQRVSSYRDGSREQSSREVTDSPAGLSTFRSAPPKDTATTQWNPTFPIMPPLPAGSFSPPPAANATDSSGSRQNSVQGQQDVSTSMMDDIDWAEWDKYFPLEHNSGQLDIQDFDYTDFNGGFGGQSMDISMLMGGGPTTEAVMGGSLGAGAAMPQQKVGGMNLPTAEELEDVSFTPPYYPQFPGEQSFMDQQSQRRW